MEVPATAHPISGLIGSVGIEVKGLQYDTTEPESISFDCAKELLLRLRGAQATNWTAANVRTIYFPRSTPSTGRIPMEYKGAGKDRTGESSYRRHLRAPVRTA